MTSPLDEVDRGILYMLQKNARDHTTTEIADAVGVSPGTVRNRIEKLEECGVIRGYHPEIDYDKAGLQLHILFICGAPNPKREELARKAREIHGVVTIHEVLNGNDNVQVEAVGTDTDDVARISDSLDEIGLSVVNSKILKSSYVQPFNHFGSEITDE